MVQNKSHYLESYTKTSKDKLKKYVFKKIKIKQKFKYKKTREIYVEKTKIQEILLKLKNLI